MYSALRESDMTEQVLPSGWEVGVRPEGSAYVCPDLGRPAEGPIRDTSAISKTYALRGFDAAVAFINEVAEVAATCGHHPDVRLTDFRHVRLELSSVSAGGVTIRDLELAKRLDEVATKYIDQA
jgi:4a-hydroxytetrahydrobiopterin dehydratase